MTDKKQVDAQLRQLGITNRGWGSAELNELPSILMPQEKITAVSHGWYDNGFATLITTTERLLLIDKRLFHLTIEDIRYEMVAEVDYNTRLFDAAIRITTVNKSLRFNCLQPDRLRKLTNYVQQRVMELRQGQFSWQQFEQTPLETPKLHTIPLTAPAGIPTQMAMVNPEIQSRPQRLPQNHFAKISLTTKHNFLPKVPRRFRPN